MIALRGAAALLTAATLLAAAGCGPTQGVVTAKGYDPAYSYILTIGGCPCYPQYVPECWRLDLRDGGDTGSVCVDQATWDRTQPGDHHRSGAVE